MDDIIEQLDERDDVSKTEYDQHRTGEGRVTVEMWHDTDALQRIAERAITGAVLSQKGMQKLAEDEALIIRETRMENVPVKSLYPDIVEQLKQESEKNEDYEYRRS